ncbi:MAG: hypothetical protein EOP87_25330 [Verrucomicrobiaceae bacterium]|nr:MAG: hypothetical protein EOP87_25330 [Verrucomicrobiaceae bacterium]
MTFCPFCGVRADIDLRQVHFRDLGPDPAMACPQCSTPLDVVEFETEPRLQVERCLTCHGMFFNPGEIEALLDAQTNPLVWLDPVQLQQIADDFRHEREAFYQKCPTCSERMGQLNFGGHSGVIVDRCGTHGIWLEGGQLRRLTEWWRAGGKLIYQHNEAERVKRLYGTTTRSGPVTSPQERPDQGTWGIPDIGLDPTILIDVIVSAASVIFDD